MPGTRVIVADDDVGERLEQGEVAPVHQRGLDRRAGQVRGGLQAAEAAADELQRLRAPTALRNRGEQIESVPQITPRGLPVSRVFRLDRGFSVAGEVRAEITRLLAVHAPRLALGRREKPTAPLAVAIRLRPHELDPRECARVIDDVRRCVDAVPDQPHQLPVVAQEKLRLISDEPTSELPGDRTWGVVAGVLRADF